MALLNKDNKYIKVESNNELVDFRIYQTIDNRNYEKIYKDKIDGLIAYLDNLADDLYLEMFNILIKDGATDADNELDARIIFLEKHPASNEAYLKYYNLLIELALLKEYIGESSMMEYPDIPNIEKYGSEHLIIEDIQEKIKLAYPRNVITASIYIDNTNTNDLGNVYIDVKRKNIFGETKDV